MRGKVRNILATILCIALLCSLAGCQRAKKEPRPAPKSTARVDDGNANAAESGDGQADVPLVVGCKSFSGQFNPFAAETLADRQAVSLTQVPLLIHDRAGKTVYHGINGELREYNGNSYTYYGIADITVDYYEKRDETEYHITLRDDLVFSDGEKLTADDVIFSLYVFCDNDYHGNVQLKNMPIKGLAEYQGKAKQEKDKQEKGKAEQEKGKQKKVKQEKEKQGEAKQEKEKQGEAKQEKEKQKKGKQEKAKQVKTISGIQRVNDYEINLVTIGYNRRLTAALEIPVCALHYYGDVSKYNADKGEFGFTRGDISEVLTKKTVPVGAGPYCFVKHENNVVYYTSNELYYLGCPQTAYLQLKDMTDILKETREQIQVKQAEYKKWEESQTETDAETPEETRQSTSVSASPEETKQTANASDFPEDTGQSANASTSPEKIAQSANNPESPTEAEPEPTPMPSVNPLAEVTEINGGTVDVMRAIYSKADLPWIYGINSNEQIAGRLLSDGKYHYIGINAKNVAVKGKGESRASKYLRKALAAILSDSRRALIESEDILAELVNYPVVKESWVSPQESEDDYETAYSTDIHGEAGGRDGQTVSMALEYLEAAGYTVADGKVKKAPKGGAVKYKVLLVNGENNPLHLVLERAQKTFESIGITLEMVSVNTEKELYKKLAKGKHQLWVGSRDKGDLELQLRYGAKAADNFFGIESKNLNQTMEKLQTKISSDERKELYRKCFDTVLGWAVEIPVCEFQEVELFSTGRIDESTVAKDTTVYYSWMNELQKVRMK